MEQGTKQLKWYHGLIMIGLSAVCIFFISPMIGRRLGLYGTLCNELLLLASAVGLTVAARGDLREVFPIRRPRWTGVFGTLLLWGGSFLAIMIATMSIAYFFPDEVMGVSQGLGMQFASLSFLISFVIVSISPAICEEAVFRGVLLHSFDNGRNKWFVIVLTGVIFGAFHGSIWRFVPTAALGMMIAYIVFETGNMLYGMILHAVNNFVPLLSVFAMKFAFSSEQFEQQMDMVGANGIPLMSIGIYVIWGTAIPLLLYIGNYLLHKETAKRKECLFGRADRKHLYVVLGLSALLFVVGVMIIAISIVKESALFLPTF